MKNRKTVKQAMKDLKPVHNGLSLFEIEDPFKTGDYHIFHVFHNEKYITVGTMCNTGLLPDFWIEKDDTFTLDKHLQLIYEIITEALYNGEIDELNGLIEI